jgi:hypothetical protein
MDIDKELESILDDPLLNLSEKETELFDIPTDMRKAMAAKNKADYIAQRKLCENFEQYRPLFKQVHQDLKQGRRNLVKISKTINLQAGHYYIVDGQMLLLEAIGEKHQSSNALPDGISLLLFFYIVSVFLEKFNNGAGRFLGHSAPSSLYGHIIDIGNTSCQAFCGALFHKCRIDSCYRSTYNRHRKEQRR